jgi:HEAT repeat protein
MWQVLCRTARGPGYPGWKVQQEWLLAGLGDSDRPVQELAETWCLNADSAGVPLLVQALYTADPRSRRAAARTLSKLGADAVWALPDSDSERKVREEVAQVLKEVEPESAKTAGKQ